MDLSIIIASFNTRELLKNCLLSIFSQKDINSEVLVVDNASIDKSVEMVKKEFSGVQLIKNRENLGFATANNIALKKANGRFLFLLNPDTIVKDQTLVKIVDFMKKNPQIGVLGAKILNPDGSCQNSVGTFYSLINSFLMLFGGERVGLLRDSPVETKEVDWVSGAALVLRREVIEKVGVLDENFFMYMEELEWCYRIRQAGFKIYFYPEAEVIHYERASGSKSEAIWGIYKGLVYFYRKHRPSWELLVLRIMLKTKAALAWAMGVLSNNRYLKVTYAKAFHLA